jgi:hypothetical protein
MMPKWQYLQQIFFNLILRAYQRPALFDNNLIIGILGSPIAAIVAAVFVAISASHSFG